MNLGLRDNQVTLWEGWDEDEHIAPNSVRIKSVGLEIEEDRDPQKEVVQQFSRTVLENSNDSPQASNSEDGRVEPVSLGLDESRTVLVVTGDGYRMVTL
jgi:hypothetical protein